MSQSTDRTKKDANPEVMKWLAPYTRYTITTNQTSGSDVTGSYTESIGAGSQQITEAYAQKVGTNVLYKIPIYTIDSSGNPDIRISIYNYKAAVDPKSPTYTLEIDVTDRGGSLTDQWYIYKREYIKDIGSDLALR